MSHCSPRLVMLWFAEKFVSLLIEQHHVSERCLPTSCCDLLKNSYLCLLNNTRVDSNSPSTTVVICWKIRIFAYWTTPAAGDADRLWSCDLLKNSYLCLLNNTLQALHRWLRWVVICWKIRIFAYWTTPFAPCKTFTATLWFAEKFVSLLIEQHLAGKRAGMSTVVICWKIRIFAYWTTPLERRASCSGSCDLLKNSYLCLLNNTVALESPQVLVVVICWKIRIFAYWTTPHVIKDGLVRSCDLLKNSYLCLLNNTWRQRKRWEQSVVICWKIRIFAYWTTPT